MYTFWGKVIRGEKRGDYLGFPTANIGLHRTIPEGVYVSKTKIDKKWHKSVSFIGAARTFGANKIFAETHIFDYDGNLYGKWITFRLLKKLRKNQKFGSVKKLVEQIKKDKKESLRYLKEHNL